MLPLLSSGRWLVLSTRWPTRHRSARGLPIARRDRQSQASHCSLANAFHCRAQVFQRLEVAVHRGETDIGDLVKSAQLLHDQLADFTGRDLGCAATKERGLDFVHQRLDCPGRDGPAMTRRGHATQKFVAAVFLAAPILLDHHQPHPLHTLVGRVALVAAQAFAPPPRGLTVLRVTRVEHFRIGVSRAPCEAAMRTLHARPLSPCCTSYGARNRSNLSTICSVLWPRDTRPSLLYNGGGAPVKAMSTTCRRQKARWWRNVHGIGDRVGVA